jgi:hypothetical protein
MAATRDGGNHTLKAAAMHWISKQTKNDGGPELPPNVARRRPFYGLFQIALGWSENQVTPFDGVEFLIGLQSIRRGASGN